MGGKTNLKRLSTYVSDSLFDTVTSICDSKDINISKFVLVAVQKEIVRQLAENPDLAHKN